MKNARHEQILKLIRKYEIETQEELASRLYEIGFPVTQATVSRDIRQLQLRKIQMPDGRQRYVAAAKDGQDRGEAYRRILGDAFVSADISANILVIHTVSGMAMAAAAAFDSLDWPEILGSIAGDDTIFAVLRVAEDAETVTARLMKLVKNKEE